MERQCVQGMCYRDDVLAMKTNRCNKAIPVQRIETQEDGTRLITDVALDCTAYLHPEAWKRKGGCPLSTIASEDKKTDKKKINPLKASKRSRR